MSKEKISDKQFLLVINGPSCGGKSTVSNVLFETYGNIFLAKGDAIKWLISDYDAPTHRGIVHNLILNMMRVSIGEGLSVIKEGALFKPEDIVEIAKEAHIPLFIANVEARWEVLEARFAERIEAKKQGTKKIANVDPVRFKELYDDYNNTKMKTELTFDSSTQTPEHIAETIVKFIRNNLK